MFPYLCSKALKVIKKRILVAPFGKNLMQINIKRL